MSDDTLCFRQEDFTYPVIDNNTKVPIESTKEENIKLRRLLWLNHGCGLVMLYHDDGEMQCHSCQIDFKRDSIEVIKKCLHSKRGLLNDN